MKTFFALLLICGIASADVQISATDLAALNAGKSVVMQGPQTPPPTNVSVVYKSGKFLWAGDWSFNGKPNYAAVTNGTTVIGFSVTGTWGGWLPFAQGNSFNTAPYNFLFFSLKPTVPNQKWSTYCVAAGDTSDGHSVDVLKYGPAPVVGQWNTYKVPLADMQLTNKLILKFAVQDQTGLAANLWYIDNVGFAP